MPTIKRLSIREVEKTYEILKIAHAKHLMPMGVSMPQLHSTHGFTQSAVALVGLYSMLGKPVTKGELTAFVRHYVSGAEDLQEGRHLGSQRGWHIVSSARKDPGTEGWPRDSYCLVSVLTPLPGWVDPKLKTPDWELKNRKPFALLNPILILNSPDSVQWEVYKILTKKFQVD
jgi:hypothetical protein